MFVFMLSDVIISLPGVEPCPIVSTVEVSIVSKVILSVGSRLLPLELLFRIKVKHLPFRSPKLNVVYETVCVNAEKTCHFLIRIQNRVLLNFC